MSVVNRIRESLLIPIVAVGCNVNNLWDTCGAVPMEKMEKNERKGGRRVVACTMWQWR
jgi:hypothetical protein